MTVQLVRSLPRTEPWTFTSQDWRDVDQAPRCTRSTSEKDRRACRALQLRRDGMDWKRIAREVGYGNAAQAKRMALAHLEQEVRS